ncbi:hypothetical protein [Allomuricauda sp. SCSIO 65647]|uniref:hypothetical protein n=1 Tax=Allomuricauda sp. SCSIO 65647 TaxID=2908843 RepID=UPI001F2FBD76|nr:hypothetical protein [Muricauda sp. SCSIO 65647]UJH68387.1 hypothetical protein L0P89_04065 [Muricauda sp. SCSIO 65647]
MLFLIGLISCEAQKLEGVWLDYNPREFIHDSIHGITSGTEGFFIDFDNHRLGMLGADSTAKVQIDYDNQILKALYHDEFELTFSTLNQDSVEIDMGENVMHVFRKLDLSHKTGLTKEEITQFLGQKCIDSVQGYKLDFTLEQFYRDKFLELPHRRNNLWNHNREDFGFWIVDKYMGNAFLVFSIGQTERKNIFQIVSISDSEIELKHLQEDGILKTVQKLKTCQ